MTTIRQRAQAKAEPTEGELMAEHGLTEGNLRRLASSSRRGVRNRAAARIMEARSAQNPSEEGYPTPVGVRRGLTDRGEVTA